MLYEYGVRLRPDWETVIAAVVDYAVKQPIVDPARIALNGWSLGGHLALRAASGEPRIAALIADPGTWSIAGGFRKAAIHRLGVPPEAAANVGALDEMYSFAATGICTGRLCNVASGSTARKISVTILGARNSSRWMAALKKFSVLLC